MLIELRTGVDGHLLGRGAVGRDSPTIGLIPQVEKPPAVNRVLTLLDQQKKLAFRPNLAPRTIAPTIGGGHPR